MRFDDNGGGRVNYEPSSFGGPVEAPWAAEPPLAIHGDADRFDHRQGNDDYTQAGDLFRLLSADQQRALCSNIAASMVGVPEDIVPRQLGHFCEADPDYAKGVAAALGRDVGRRAPPRMGPAPVKAEGDGHVPG